MSAPIPYLHLPGTARDALEFYRNVFGGELELRTHAEAGTDQAPSDAIAHGRLYGLVDLYAADAAPDQAAGGTGATMLALFGTAEPSTLRTWFVSLADGGEVVEELQRRPWGASDGQVRDRFGVLWLIGYEHGTGQS